MTVQSLEETERLVTEAQGLPPPFPPLSTLPDAHLGDGIIDGIMEEARLEFLLNASSHACSRTVLAAGVPRSSSRFASLYQMQACC